jgi:hypothetical protein
MPWAEAERSMRLVGADVMLALQELGREVPPIRRPA